MRCPPGADIPGWWENDDPPKFPWFGDASDGAVLGVDITRDVFEPRSIVAARLNVRVVVLAVLDELLLGETTDCCNARCP